MVSIKKIKPQTTKEVKENILKKIAPKTPEEKVVLTNDQETNSYHLRNKEKREAIAGLSGFNSDREPRDDF